MKNFTSLAVFSLLAVGCGDNAEPEADLVEEIEFPRTCAELLQGKPAPLADGEYKLYIDSSKPWTAYCADLDTKKPIEYLTLPQGGVMNYSMYRAGGRSGGTDVMTRYDKVRIDPLTLKLDISDQTFAVSDGSATHPNGQTITSMPFGVAMTCGGGYATAIVDISNTPFALQNKFALGGDAGVRGFADPWASNQVIEMWTEGDCGWIAPDVAPVDPMNGAGSFMIGLTYQ